MIESHGTGVQTLQAGRGTSLGGPPHHLAKNGRPVSFAHWLILSGLIGLAGCTSIMNSTHHMNVKPRILGYSGDDITVNVKLTKYNVLMLFVNSKPVAHRSNWCVSIMKETENGGWQFDRWSSKTEGIATSDFDVSVTMDHSGLLKMYVNGHGAKYMPDWCQAD